MKILEFLCQRPDGLGHLTDDERESAINFALLCKRAVNPY